MVDSTSLINDPYTLITHGDFQAFCQTLIQPVDKCWSSWSQSLALENFDHALDGVQYELFQDQLNSVPVSAHSQDYEEAFSTETTSPSDPLTPPAFPSPPTPAPSSQLSPSSSPGSNLSSECLSQLDPLPLTFLHSPNDDTKSGTGAKQSGSYARFRVNAIKRPRGARQQTGFGGSVQPELRALQPPPPDGYKWRKYGRKFNKGICRSYYRCINSECPAKVIFH